MASDLGVAILKFIAHTEELEKGCKKAEKVSESTFKRMGKDAAGFGKSFGKHLGSAFAGIGKSAVMGLSAGVGIELTQGLEAIVSKSFDRIEKLASFGKLSRQLQLDSSEFSGFAGLVENEVGIETDRFAKALRNLSEASLKTDENTTRLFKNIGINQQEFAQLNPLQQYAELMSKLGDNGVDDELAVTELLSEKLSDLGEHISMSREELEKQAKAYQRSNEQIAKAWVANDQLEQSNKELSIAFDKLVESITPGINMIADQLPGAIDALTGQFTNLDGTVDSTMKKAIVEFAGWIDHVQLAREAVSGLGKDITEAFGGDKNSKWGMDRINANLAGSFGWFTSQTGKLIGNDVLKQEGDFIQQDSLDWINRLKNGIPEVGSNAEAAANAFDELSKKLKENAEERRKEMMINSLPLYKRQRQLHEKEMKEKEEKQQKEKEIKFDSSHTAILAGSAEEAAVRARAFDTNKHAAAQLAEQKNTVAAVNKVESAIKAMKFEVV